MTTQFQILFTLKISHTYYNAGCMDFDFVFPPDVTQLLRNGRMVSKILDGKLYIFFERAEDSDRPRVSIVGKKLRLGLRLLNPMFNNFTALDFDFHSLTPLYGNSDLTHPRVLDAPVMTFLSGQVFSHPLGDPSRPATVTLADPHDHVLFSDTVTKDRDRATVSYDLTGEDAGLYTAREAHTAGTKTVSYYLDTTLHHLGTFGIVEIEIGEDFYSSPPEFEVKFNAKQETQRYYVVAKNYAAADLSKCTVTDAGFTEEGRPEVKFTARTDAAIPATDVHRSLVQDATTTLLLFESNSLVPRKDQGRKKIHLSLKNEVIIEHLPQPGANNANSDLIIQLSQPKRK